MAQEQSTVNAILSNKRTVNEVDSSALVLLTTDDVSIEQIIFDNTLNSSQSYLKLWDANATTDVSLGSTVPNFILPAAASTSVDYNFTCVDAHGTLSNRGAYFSLGCVYTVVTTAGTGGSSSPTNNVTVKFLSSV